MTKTRYLRTGRTMHLGVLALAGAALLVGCDESVTEPPPPVATTVEVAPSSVELTEIGATAQLTATVRDADGVAMPTAAVTWSSSNTAVATVGEDGTVEAAGEGSTTITAQSGDATGNAQVTVVLPAPTPTEVVVEPDAATLTEVGATVQLSATVLDATGAEIEGAAVTWASSDAEVASVGEDGLVEAITEGTATITATSGEASGTAEITVELPAPGPAVLISPETLLFTEIGATAELSATVLDEEGVEVEGAEVTWSTSDADVATVDEEGLVEAMGEGTATITATSGEISGTAEVTVELAVPSPSEVVVTPEEVTLTEIGATAELTATVLDEDGVEIEGAAVVWTTSDADVATVDEEGLVEAVGEGTATITATSGEVSGTAEVTVDLAAASPSEVVVVPSAATLNEIGATAQFMAMVLDEDGVEIEGAAVVWTTSDADVATVDEEGLVEAVGEGTATITATVDDIEGTAEVTVDVSAPSPAEVVVSPEAVTLTEIGATTELTATVLDADGVEIEGAVVVWTTSDADVAVVDQEGVVTAVGEGTATISAAIGEVSGTAEVTVEL
jgi:uncharacterized protein YjdB